MSKILKVKITKVDEYDDKTKAFIAGNEKKADEIIKAIKNRAAYEVAGIRMFLKEGKITVAVPRRGEGVLSEKEAKDYVLGALNAQKWVRELH